MKISWNSQTLGDIFDITLVTVTMAASKIADSFEKVLILNK